MSVITRRNELASSCSPNIEVGKWGGFMQSTYANVVAQGYAVMEL